LTKIARHTNRNMQIELTEDTIDQSNHQVWDTRQKSTQEAKEKRNLTFVIHIWAFDWESYPSWTFFTWSKKYIFACTSYGLFRWIMFDYMELKLDEAGIFLFFSLQRWKMQGICSIFKIYKKCLFKNFCLTVIILNWDFSIPLPFTSMVELFPDQIWVNAHAFWQNYCYSNIYGFGDNFSVTILVCL
jgi:hypothetical protein